MLLEICKNGSLADILQSAAEKEVSWKAEVEWNVKGIMRKFALEIAEGVGYMHSHDPPILHRDLKTQNVLVAGDSAPETWVAKVCDLGEAREFHGVDDNLSMVGTLHYQAPEMHFCDPYDQRADVYSYGMLLYEMAHFRKGGLNARVWQGWFILNCKGR